MINKIFEHLNTKHCFPTCAGGFLQKLFVTMLSQLLRWFQFACYLVRYADANPGVPNKNKTGWKQQFFG